MKLWKIVLFALFVFVASCAVQNKTKLQYENNIAGI